MFHPAPYSVRVTTRTGLNPAEMHASRTILRAHATEVRRSRSGLTRLVDRLVREGLAERRPCPTDARGTLAVLTDAGLSRLRDAWPTHRRGVAEHVTDRFSPAEIERLAALLSKIVDGSS